MDYTIRREMAQIIGAIDYQLGVRGKPVTPLPAPAGEQSDFEKLIREKCARLTESQRTRVTQSLHIHRI